MNRKMFDDIYEGIAIAENAELVITDIKANSVFSGVEKSYVLKVPYKSYVIEIKNAHSPDPVGSFFVEILNPRKEVNFRIKTKSHFVKLITFSNSITEVKGKDLNFINDIKLSDSFLELESLINKTQFEPEVFAKTVNNRLTIITEYHTMLADKTSFIKPMLNFYKYIIDKIE